MNIISLFRKAMVAIAFLLGLSVVVPIAYFEGTLKSEDGPFGAWGTIEIEDTPSANNTFGEVEKLASETGVAVAQKRYVYRDSLVVETLNVDRSLSDAANKMPSGDAYSYDPDKSIEIHDSRGPHRDIGYWVIFGDDSDVGVFIDTLAGEGYVFLSYEGKTRGIIAILTDDISIAILLLVMMSVLFLCSVVQANRDEKMTSIAYLLGEKPGVSRLVLVLRHTAVFGIICVIVTVSTISVRQIAAGNNFRNVYATDVDCDISVFFLWWFIAAVLIVSVAYVTSPVFGGGLLRSLKGYRPFVFQQIVAMGVLILVTLGVVMSFSSYESSMMAQQSILNKQQRWLKLPEENTWALSVPWLDEDKIFTLLPVVKNMLREVQNSDMDVLVSYSTPQCTSDDRDLRCLWVSPKYLEYVETEEFKVKSLGVNNANVVDVFMSDDVQVGENEISQSIKEFADLEYRWREREGSLDFDTEGPLFVEKISKLPFIARSFLIFLCMIPRRK